jgi:septum site-determining protein MinC
MNNDAAMIKGDKDGLNLIVDENADFDTILADIRRHLNVSPQFFKGATIRLQQSEEFFTAQQQQQLQDLVNEYGMKLIIEEKRPQPVRPLFAEKRNQPGSKASRVTSPSPKPKRATLEDEQALLCRRNLRSGQSIVYPGNVIIQGDVNPGAQVVASGDIMVFGTLRGVAHAGAEGDQSAVVLAYRLEPMQLRIGSLISRAPDEKGSRPQGPEIARIRDGVIQIEEYKP